MTVDDAKDVKFFRHRREEISVFAMNAQITALMTEVAGVKSMVAKTKTDIDTKVAADLKKIEDATSQSLKDVTNKVATDIGAVKTDVAGKLTTAAASTATSIKNAATNTAAALKSAAAASDLKLAAMKKVVDAAPTTASVASAVANPPVHMWSGGPKAHNRGSGWADYDMSRVDYDTAAPYFQKISNTRFRALQDGLFSYSIDTMVQ